MPSLATPSIVVWPHRGVGHVDHLRVHAGLHGIEDIAAGQVDRGRGLPGEVDVGLVGGDHRVDHALHVAAGQHVRFHLRRADGKPGAVRLNAGVDDRQRVHLPQPHADQIDEADAGAADRGADVQADELENDGEDDQQDNEDENDDDPDNRVAGVFLGQWNQSLHEIPL